MNHYEALVAQSKKLKLLESISGLLGWDQETYMPKGAGNARAEQLEVLASMIHEKKTSKEYAKLLDELINLKTGKPRIDNLSQHQIANLKLLKRDYQKQAALPAEFVKDFANLTSRAQLVWAKSRKENDFATYLPFLEAIVEMNRQKVDFLGYDEHPYDALLDEFEPEMTVSRIDPLFTDLGKKLSEFVTDIGKRKKLDTTVLHGQFDHDKQIAFGEFVLEKVGYNLDFGRLDLSTHPFSTAMHPTDSRITSRIHPTSVFDYISSVFHEAGHGLYEMGLPVDHYGMPVGEAISLSIHESQSRFWETFIGQSLPCWQVLYPKLQTLFPEQLGSVSLQTFYQAINQVSPSFIRVESDEVTYCLHILVRYELEKALISGELKADQIPEAWEDLMENLVGIRPKTHQEGCLQDIHWSFGAFGYFPTYALGSLYGAMFFDAFEDVHPDWKERLINEGNFHFITHWLRETIHQHGHLYSSDELALRVTGSPLDTTAYFRYLKKKYGDLYAITT